MGKRLLLGLVKGLVIGGAIGAGISYGLLWSISSGGLLAFLLAMGAAGTTGVFAGRPPWKEGAWLEALLKGVVGVMVGSLAYWLAATYAAGPELTLPAVGSLPALAPAPWTGLPVLFLPAIAALYGSLVELDNTGEPEKSEKKKGAAPSAAPRARVADDAAEDELEEPAATKPARARKG
jgi:hypothetical protein